MISRKEEVLKAYNKSETTVEIDYVHELIDNLVDTIKDLENICDELVNLPKGQESHSWSDYKARTKNDRK